MYIPGVARRLHTAVSVPQSPDRRPHSDTDTHRHTRDPAHRTPARADASRATQTKSTRPEICARRWRGVTPPGHARIPSHFATARTHPETDNPARTSVHLLGGEGRASVRDSLALLIARPWVAQRMATNTHESRAQQCPPNAPVTAHRGWQDMKGSGRPMPLHPTVSSLDGTQPLKDMWHAGASSVAGQTYVRKVVAMSM